MIIDIPLRAPCLGHFSTLYGNGDGDLMILGWPNTRKYFRLRSVDIQFQIPTETISKSPKE